MSAFHSPGVSIGSSRVSGAEDSPQPPMSCGAALPELACECLDSRAGLALSLDLLCVWSAWKPSGRLSPVHRKNTQALGRLLTTPGGQATHSLAWVCP